MMKDEFLRRLEERLRENNVSNIDDVISKYRKRYDFGLESGLSDEEIQSMLGDIDEIVKLYSNNTNESSAKKNDFKNQTFGNMRIDIETVSDTITFERSNDNTVHLYFENINEDSYDIKKSDNEIIIKYINKKFFSLNRRTGGNIIVSLPEDMTFSSIKLATVSGDIDSTIELNTRTFNIEMVSGDSEIKEVNCNDIRFHLVSGDVSFGVIRSSLTEISTVSGDAEIDCLYTDDLKVDSISGDVIIHDALDTMREKVSSISGTIKIKDRNLKNFKKNIKEGFRK